jgi:hypothetical protein
LVHSLFNKKKAKEGRGFERSCFLLFLIPFFFSFFFNSAAKWRIIPLKRELCCFQQIAMAMYFDIKMEIQENILKSSFCFVRIKTFGMIQS